MTTSPPETETVVINGFTFAYRKRYAAGHVCTVAEANILNQQLKKNLRRNFADSVPMEFQPENEAEETYRAFRDYESSYHFGGPDPVEIEAFIIALEVAKRRIKGEGKLLSDYSKLQLNDLAAEVLAGPKSSEILAAARSRVVAIQAAAAREAQRSDGHGE